MTVPTTFLVTGGNRGLGRALVEHYLAQPNYTVIAAVRDPSHTTAQSLHHLPTAQGSSVVVVKIDSFSVTDPSDAVKALETEHDIHALDTVVANAGISKVFPSVSELRIDDMTEHLTVNVSATVRLFQAVLPLLNRSPAPRFVAMSTSAASLGGMEHRNFPNAAYGTSKVALNYIMRKIHFENPRMTAFPLDPGWVQTDMGNSGAQALGLEKAEISLKESIDGIVKVIDASTRETASGKFMVYTGAELEW